MSNEPKAEPELTTAQEVLAAMRASDKRMVQALRQVLMQDLELTREVVRAVMVEIVQEEAARALAGVKIEEVIRDRVSNELWTSRRFGAYGNKSIENMVAEVTANVVTDWLKRHMLVTFRENEDQARQRPAL